MRTTVFLLVLLVLSGYCAAKTIYVDAASPDDPGPNNPNISDPCEDGSFGHPFDAIQEAIDIAVSDDAIEIFPGLYTGDGNYEFDPNGAAITIRSTEPNNPNVVANTIIDPNGAGRGFFFHSGEDSNCIVAGLTVRNGATNGSGGGIFCFGSTPTIKGCVIINNEAEGSGGGIYCYNSEAAIINCIISGNRAAFGGGIRCSLSSDIKVTNCTITRNSADPEWRGDGIYCSSNSSPVIKNSVIWANGSEQIYASDGEPIITYSNIQDGWSGNGNIDADPCFASFDLNGDPNMWDFHLQSVYGRWDSNSQMWVYDGNTSPCVDTGDPNSDWSGEPWPNGKRINMGCYGGMIQASMNGNPADFDVNGAVNFVDFAGLADRWMAEQTCIEDLNGNGVVEFADLDMFANNWLWQKE